MKLDSKFAQPLVETLEEVIPFKVTIIDDEGIIVGSSDPERLGVFHPSAYELICGREPPEHLENGEYVDIPDMVVLGYGEKIIYDGECIGVIGIVGPPEERKDVMKSAQMILKLLLDRMTTRQEINASNVDRNAFLIDILQGFTKREKWHEKKAHRYGIDLEIPRYIIVIHRDVQKNGESQIKGKIMSDEDWIRVINSVITSNDDALCRTERGEMVLLSAAGRYKDETRREKSVERQVALLFDKLKETAGIDPLIGISEECGDYLSYKTGYSEALNALEIGYSTQPLQKIYYYKQMRLGRLICDMSEEDRSLLRTGIIDRLLDENKPQLYETLKVYFEENMNVSNTASRLFIHRNTLQYRFKQIYEITGCDIYKLDDMIQLRLAVMEYQLFSDETEAADIVSES